MTVRKSKACNKNAIEEPQSASGNYTLEIVANVAATLAAGNQSANNASRLSKAAKDAVILIQACEKELLALSEMKSNPPSITITEIIGDLNTVYAKNSFRREMTRILNRDSWTNAQPIFKEFLRYQETNRHLDPRFEQPRIPKYLDTYAERAIEDYQRVGLGGTRLKVLEAEVNHWYEHIYLPNQRSKNGQKGGRGNVKKQQV